MNCNKYALLNYCVFFKAGRRKFFSFKPVRSAKKVADPCSSLYVISCMRQPVAQK